MVDPGNRRERTQPKDREKNTEDGDADQDKEEQKARPATRMQSGVSTRVLDRQLLARLKGVNRFVLGSVVLEHALDVLHQSDQVDVANQDAHLDHPVDEVEQRALGLKHQRGQKMRKGNEKPHPHHEGECHRSGDCPGRKLLSLLFARPLARNPGREAERLHALNQ